MPHPAFKNHPNFFSLALINFNSYKLLLLVNSHYRSPLYQNLTESNDTLIGHIKPSHEFCVSTSFCSLLRTTVPWDITEANFG